MSKLINNLNIIFKLISSLLILFMILLILGCSIIFSTLIENTEFLVDMVQGVMVYILLLDFNLNKITHFSDPDEQGNQSNQTNQGTQGTQGIQGTQGTQGGQGTQGTQPVSHTNGSGQIYPLVQEHLDPEQAEYPLNVAEAYDDSEIPSEQLPYNNEEEHALTDLRNDVRRTYSRITEIEREQNYAQSEAVDHVVNAHLQEFYRAQNELREYLNQNHEGKFTVNPNI
jgi:hypothetical protein